MAAEHVPSKRETGIRPISRRETPEKTDPEKTGVIFEEVDGAFRLSFASAQGAKYELPLNLPNATSALAMAKFVRRALITKKTCLSLSHLEHACSVYAEGSRGIGQSLLRIDDDAFLVADGGEKFSKWVRQAIGNDTVLADGWNLRALLKNPGNDGMVKILSASSENKGKTVAEILAEFLESVPVSELPKRSDVRAR